MAEGTVPDNAASAIEVPKPKPHRRDRGGLFNELDDLECVVAYAVVIGVNNSAILQPDQELEYAESDAVAMAECLSNELGICVVSLLLGVHATKANVEAAIDAMIEQAIKNPLVLPLEHNSASPSGRLCQMMICFAGHGEPDGSLVLADQLFLFNVKSHFPQHLDYSLCPHLLLMMDNCYSCVLCCVERPEPEAHFPEFHRLSQATSQIKPPGSATNSTLTWLPNQRFTPHRPPIPAIVIESLGLAWKNSYVQPRLERPSVQTIGSQCTSWNSRSNSCLTSSTQILATHSFVAATQIVWSEAGTPGVMAPAIIPLACRPGGGASLGEFVFLRAYPLADPPSSSSSTTSSLQRPLPDPPVAELVIAEAVKELQASIVGSRAQLKTQCILLHGPGGAGKTTSANWLCWDPELRSIFGSSIFWFTIGRDEAQFVTDTFLTKNITQALSSRFGAIVIQDQLLSVRDQFYHAISKLDSPMLVVLDDLGQRDVMEYIWALIASAPKGSPPIIMIVTARPRLLEPPIQNERQPVVTKLIEIKWSETEAVQYLKQFLGPYGFEFYRLQALARTASFNAKTLDFVVGQFRSNDSISFYQLLRNANRPVETSIAMLPAKLDRQRLDRLILVKNDSQLHESLLLRSDLFWTELPNDNTRLETLEQLASLHLIKRNAKLGTVSWHDVVFEWIRGQMSDPEIEARHREFVGQLTELITKHIKPQCDFPILCKYLQAPTPASKAAASAVAPYDKAAFVYAMKNVLYHLSMASTAKSKEWTIAQLKNTIGNSNWLKKRLKLDLKRRPIDQQSASSAATVQNGSSITSEYVEPSSLEFDIDLVIRTLEKLDYSKDLLKELDDLKLFLFHCVKGMTSIHQFDYQLSLVIADSSQGIFPPAFTCPSPLVLTQTAKVCLAKPLSDLKLLIATGFDQCNVKVWQDPENADNWKLVTALNNMLFVWTPPSIDLSLRLGFDSPILDFDVTLNSIDFHIGVITRSHGWCIIDGKTGTTLSSDPNFESDKLGNRVFMTETTPKSKPQIVLASQYQVISNGAKFSVAIESLVGFVHLPPNDLWHFLYTCKSFLFVIEGPSGAPKKLSFPDFNTCGILMPLGSPWTLVVSNIHGKKFTIDVFADDPKLVEFSESMHLLVKPLRHGKPNSLWVKVGSSTYSVLPKSTGSIELKRFKTSQHRVAPAPTLSNRRCLGIVQAVFDDPAQPSRQLGVFIFSNFEVCVTHLDALAGHQRWTLKSRNPAYSCAVVNPTQRHWQILVGARDGMNLASDFLSHTAVIISHVTRNVSVLRSQVVARDYGQVKTYDLATGKGNVSRATGGPSVVDFASPSPTSQLHVVYYDELSNTLVLKPFIGRNDGDKAVDNTSKGSFQLWQVGTTLHAVANSSQGPQLFYMPGWNSNIPESGISVRCRHTFAMGKLIVNMKHKHQCPDERSDLFIIWQRPTIRIHSFKQPLEPLAEFRIETAVKWWFETSTGVGLALGHATSAEVIYLDFQHL